MRFSLIFRICKVIRQVIDGLVISPLLYSYFYCCLGLPIVSNLENFNGTYKIQIRMQSNENTKVDTIFCLSDILIV